MTAPPDKSSIKKSLRAAVPQSRLETRALVYPIDDTLESRPFSIGSGNRRAVDEFAPCAMC
jgi:hypothetical protein